MGGSADGDYRAYVPLGIAVAVACGLEFGVLTIFQRHCPTGNATLRVTEQRRGNYRKHVAAIWTTPAIPIASAQHLDLSTVQDLNSSGIPLSQKAPPKTAGLGLTGRGALDSNQALPKAR